jgi:Polyketide cyclase / dehydrase and lipid transport
MQKFWEGSVHVSAPVDEVWSYVGDFNRHLEWDRFTMEIELAKAGDELGVGSEWKVKEQLGMFLSQDKKSWWDHGAAPGKREVKHVVPKQKIVWHTYPVPKMGVNAEFTFELIPESEGTLVRQHVTLNVPGVVDVVGLVLLPRRDKVQQALWQKNLEQPKSVVEGVPAREAVAV